jgi:hypothetical protein
MHATVQLRVFCFLVCYLKTVVLPVVLYGHET